MHDAGNSIPWSDVIRFHMDIVGRGEESFFSFSRDDEASERWVYANESMMADLAGPWSCKFGEGSRPPFWIGVDRGTHESVFLGGPCYVAFERRDAGQSVPVQRPLLYREVELTATEEGCNITPRQGKWAFCPPVWGLLDQAQVVLPDNEQAFLGETIDEAAQRAKDRDESLASAVLATLIDRLPDLREVLSRRLPGPAARRGSAPPWILFAPQASGAFKYNRHLMADHRRIAEQLTASAERAGGLGILEGGWTHEVDREAGIQPLVALNDRQRAVVERVIGGAPLTVVTGPPGCGKSQVVLSVLLNAWACGQSVLFVSSNNNAVDVVRERLERLDSAVPIAVRAGSKEKNNAVGLLRNISTRVGQRRGQPPSDAPAAGEAQLQPLIERREALRKMRDSRVPQKITEQARSAMVAYAEERRLIDAIEKEAGRLEHEWRRHGFGARRLARTRQTVEESLDAVRAWIDRKPDFEQQQRIDDEERRRLDQAITDAQQARDTALGGAGVTDPRTVEELMRHGSPDDLATWHAGLDRILKYAAGDLLTPPEWLVEFERWSSAREAEQASRDLKSLGDRVSRRFDDLSVRIESLGERAQAMTQALDELHRCGMETPPAIGSGLIDDWKKAFSVTVTAIPSRMDRFFPWRPLPKARRRLRRIEQMLLKCLPLATWRHVELIESPGGRDRVSEVLESIARWRQTKEEQRAAGEVSVQVSDVFATLTEEAKHLGATPKSAVQGAGYLSPSAWDDLAKEAHARSRETDAAAGAWRRRADHENALDSVRQWLERWRMLGSAVHDTLAEGSEAPLAHALRRLASDPGTPALRQLGEADGKCDVAGFLRAWKTARRHHTAATDLRRQREDIPSPTARVMAWWDQAPEALVTTFAGVSRDRWPEPEVLDERLAPLHGLLEETVRFLDDDRPDWKERARKERKWANEELHKAAELVPTAKPEGRALRERCMEATVECKLADRRVARRVPPVRNRDARCRNRVDRPEVGPKWAPDRGSRLAAATAGRRRSVPGGQSARNESGPQQRCPATGSNDGVPARVARGTRLDHDREVGVVRPRGTGAVRCGPGGRGIAVHVDRPAAGAVPRPAVGGDRRQRTAPCHSDGACDRRAGPVAEIRAGSFSRSGRSLRPVHPLCGGAATGSVRCPATPGALSQSPADYRLLQPAHLSATLAACAGHARPVAPARRLRSLPGPGRGLR